MTRLASIITMLLAASPTAASDYIVDKTPNPGPRLTSKTTATPTDLRILFFYDQAFLDDHPNVDARFQEFIDWTNDAFQMSGMQTTATLAASDFVDHNFGNTQSALDDLRTRSGSFGAANDLQALHQADIISYVTGLPPSDACGRATLSSATPSISNTVHVLHDTCGSKTFAHEVGHNLGSGHDAANDCAFAAFPFACGHSNGLDRSIMITGATDQFFSNPLLQCTSGPCGVPEGQPDAADNARAMPLVAQELAARAEGRLTFEMPAYSVSQFVPLDVRSRRDGWYGRLARFELVDTTTMMVVDSRTIDYGTVRSIFAFETQTYDTSALAPGSYRLDVFPVDRPAAIESVGITIDPLDPPNVAILNQDVSFSPVFVDVEYSSDTETDITLNFTPGDLSVTESFPAGQDQFASVSGYFLCGETTVSYTVSATNPAGTDQVGSGDFTPPMCFDPFVGFDATTGLGVLVSADPSGNFPLTLRATFAPQMGSPVQVDHVFQPTASTDVQQFAVELPVGQAINGMMYEFSYVLITGAGTLPGDFTQDFTAVLPEDIFGSGFETVPQESISSP